MEKFKMGYFKMRYSFKAFRMINFLNFLFFICIVGFIELSTVNAENITNPCINPTSLKGLVSSEDNIGIGDATVSVSILSDNKSLENENHTMTRRDGHYFFVFPPNSLPSSGKYKLKVSATYEKYKGENISDITCGESKEVNIFIAGLTKKDISKDQIPTDNNTIKQPNNQTTTDNNTTTQNTQNTQQGQQGNNWQADNNTIKQSNNQTTTDNNTTTQDTQNKQQGQQGNNWQADNNTIKQSNNQTTTDNNTTTDNQNKTASGIQQEQPKKDLNKIIFLFIALVVVIILAIYITKIKNR